jgi:uncharacterized membrane protein YsdA (DUF1294 family)
MNKKDTIFGPSFPIWEILVLILMWIDKKRKAENGNGDSEKNEDS